LPAFDAAIHLRTGNGPAHDGDGGRDHVDEGSFDRFEVSSELAAEEGDGGKVESQLFDRRIGNYPTK
jgi:hypothetical protein